MKMRSANNQIKIGTILSYLQMGLNVLIGLVYTPVMIRCLGTSEYGLYNTVASTISMLSILSLGFNSSYVRFFSKYKQENRNEEIYRLNGLFLIVFTIIGIIALTCGLFISFNLSYVFDQGLTASEYYIARILVTILTINMAVSFPMSVFQNIISANEKFIILKILGMGKTVIGPLITLPLLLMGYRSIAMVLCSFIVSLSVDILYLFYVLVVLKNKFIFRGFEKHLFYDLFSYTVFIAINMIIDQINWNIDKILLGRFKGTTAVAVYSVGYTLYHYYSMFSTSISSLFTPKIHRIVNTCSDNTELRLQLTSIFIMVGRIQFLILALLLSGLIFFGEAFISFWAGEGYTQSYFVLLLLVCPATIPLIQNLGIEIQRAENKHQFRSFAYVIMAIINLVMSIYLCQMYGAVGSAIGTALSLLIANGLVMNIFYYKKCYIDVISFWKSIGSLARGLILPIIVGVIIRQYLNLNHILNLLIGIMLYGLVYILSMFLFGMNMQEKNMIIMPLKRIGNQR